MYENVKKAFGGLINSIIQSIFILLIPTLVIGYTYQMVLMPNFDWLPFINYLETFLILLSLQMIIFIFKK